uniref:Uncharacterized protein n=1 Tax=Trichuris muris TaxID=70415 RepID=A0A5S6Q0Q5_TRIMR
MKFKEPVRSHVFQRAGNLVFTYKNTKFAECTIFYGSWYGEYKSVFRPSPSETAENLSLRQRRLHLQVFPFLLLLLPFLAFVGPKEQIAAYLRRKALSCLIFAVYLVWSRELRTRTFPAEEYGVFILFVHTATNVVHFYIKTMTMLPQRF